MVIATGQISNTERPFKNTFGTISELTRNVYTSVNLSGLSYGAVYVKAQLSDR